MEDEWSYLLFDTLMSKILNGHQSVQEPIRLYNLHQTKTNNISFLNHLLMYENVQKDNLLETLFDVYNRFIEKIDELKNKKSILNMMTMVNDEWYNKDSCDCHLPIKKNFFEGYQRAVGGKKKLTVVCEDCIEQTHGNKKIPYESFIRKQSPTDRLLDSGIILSGSVLKDLQDNLSETEKMLVFFKNFDRSFFIDLSIKHKPLYFQLNGVRDESIPDNIHLIFSNFLNIHNLLYKQFVQHHNSLKEMISEVQTTSSDVHNRKKEIDLANKILEQRRVIKDCPFKVGDDALYKGRDRVKVFDIDRNVPEGEEPIIYIEMMDGKKRDTPLMNLSMIPDDPSEDEGEESEEGDEDTFYSLDESGELMLGGGEVKGAERVSQKLINSFF